MEDGDALINNELVIQTQKRPRRTLAQARTNLKNAMASLMSRQRAKAITRKLFELAESGNITAIAMIQDRLLGKPSVGSTATVVDEEMSESIQKRLKKMSKEDLHLAYQLSLKMADAATERPVVIEQPPDLRLPELPQEHTPGVQE